MEGKCKHDEATCPRFHVVFQQMRLSQKRIIMRVLTVVALSSLVTLAFFYRGSEAKAKGSRSAIITDHVWSTMIWSFITSLRMQIDS